MNNNGRIIPRTGHVPVSNSRPYVTPPQNFVPIGLNKFTHPLNVNIDHYPENYLAQVTRQFFFYLEENKQQIIIVPPGFCTDFTSVPQFARSFYSVLDETAKAAVIHDYLYSGGWIRDFRGNYIRQPSKAEADNIYVQGLKILGASKTEIRIKHFAVKNYGEGYWVNPKYNRYGNEPYQRQSSQNMLR